MGKAPAITPAPEGTSDYTPPSDAEMERELDKAEQSSREGGS